MEWHYLGIAEGLYDAYVRKHAELTTKKSERTGRAFDPLPSWRDLTAIERSAWMEAAREAVYLVGAAVLA